MCTTSTLRRIVAASSVLCVFSLLGVAAHADMPAVAFELTVATTDGQHTATVPIMTNDGLLTLEPVRQAGARGAGGGGYQWHFDLRHPMQVTDGGMWLATFNSLTIDVFEDPEVNLNFSVQAGSADTSFHIASSLLSFATIGTPVGTATAGMTVQDTLGDGATLTKKATLGGAYLAQYNGWAGDPINGPQGTTFHEGITTINAMPFGQGADSTTLGWTSIGAPVSSMSTLIAFSLTAQDLASGTSHFEIIPEPASLLLIGIGALTLVRRR